MPSIIELGAPDRKNGDLTVTGDSNALLSLVKDQISDFPPGKQYSIAIKEVPVTVERLPYYPKDGDRLQDPGTARANIAASNESPNGTSQDDWAQNHQHQTVVQQHVVYWDKDEDGIIWPLDTYRGCRAWGWNPILCLLATFLINFNLSYPTSPSWIPDPFFRIHISNLHKDKHGSDSMTYDNEGRFRPQNFEDLFAKYDRGNKGGLDAWDLVRMHKGQRMAMDFFGWSASFFEWLATYLLLWPEDG
ncbi:Caleosin-domain-containing protein, partial [Aureobasidium melanogenum]